MARVANASNERLIRFEYRYIGKRQRMVPAAQVANCVSASCAPHASLRTYSACVPPCKSANAYDATTYTQFATWAAVDYLARHAVVRVCEAGEAHLMSAGNERGSRDCRVKRKTLWGPSGRKKN
ncbi:hypothetical protein PTKU46_15840 [Paraburkholderia terrae]